MDNEFKIYEGNDVLITQKKVIIGNSSYLLKDINYIKCLIEKGIHRKIFGFKILWLMILVWIPFLLTLIIALFVNEKAMMGSLNLGVFGLIFSFGLIVESFSEKCWLVINNNKIMLFNNKSDLENLIKIIKSNKNKI